MADRYRDFTKRVRVATQHRRVRFIDNQGNGSPKNMDDIQYVLRAKNPPKK